MHSPLVAKHRTCKDAVSATPAIGDAVHNVEHYSRTISDTSNNIEHITSGWNGTLVPTTDPYTLKRDCNANSRLTAQHYLWKDTLGYLAHPSIPALATDLKVADVATGNGIWLHDFARDKPASIELHGFDISLDQVGPSPWLPANIRMHIWNIFEEPPAQFVGYFDIVHVRLITVVIKQNDPRPALKNLWKLLKPGGYLQWDEVDTIGCSIKTVPLTTAENLDALFAQLKGRDTWKYRLVQTLNDNGFADAELNCHEYGLGMARFWSDL